MNYLVVATAICYAASLAGYVTFLGTARREIGRAATLLLASGVVLHYMALVARSSRQGMLPYNDLYGSLSLFAWLLAVTYLGRDVFHRQRSVGAFVMPVVLIVFAMSDAGNK